MAYKEAASRLGKLRSFFCWESAGPCRIVGLAEFKAPSLLRDPDDEALFTVKYLTKALESKPGIVELREVRILKEASFLKLGPATTVLSISDQRAVLLLRFIYSKNPSLPVVWPDVDLKPAIKRR